MKKSENVHEPQNNGDHDVRLASRFSKCLAKLLWAGNNPSCATHCKTILIFSEAQVCSLMYNSQFQ